MEREWYKDLRTKEELGEFLKVSDSTITRHIDEMKKSAKFSEYIHEYSKKILRIEFLGYCQFLEEKESKRKKML
ncbi:MULTISPECIES: hypothetical protein [Lactococcus]|jgi:DNA-binding MarR family transcriptional regulator|uniref:Uncharacterized protein n=2 Tax=Lactococcus TaxID=1357 RepID=A0A252CBD6_9LACT|nr:MULTISPECIES: hypothetical protein [Lactococcus]OUK03659.1 hypothetical protein BZZ03_10275 [Lactococcus petauri]USI65576.1 hypothetical protein LMK05_12315 [Lactococcus petauri]USI68039.1 hypothetical protein LMK04_11375 [Lactococcus petauri]USJ20298.1 hypothetical protein LMK00_10955 [Lactococcus formosensis]WJE12700.1 hypothetical protein QR692_11255 [Lactococcus petauri]